MNRTSSTDQKVASTRILHFVTGGFSGATQVAIDLSLAALHTPGVEVLLVLRRKRSTDEAKIEKLRQQGLQVKVVSNWMHAITVWELRKIIRSFKPDVVFAHGFSDHIWGRRAAVAEGVAHIFHIEHNSRERYTSRRLKQAMDLMPYTEACIGVSEGVRTSLIERGFDPAKCIAIPNGIDLERFPESLLKPWDEREAAIIMASRFARQKDHATLIKAVSILKERGITPTLYLAGAGKSSLRKKPSCKSQNWVCNSRFSFSATSPTFQSVFPIPRYLFYPPIGKACLWPLSKEWLQAAPVSCPTSSVHAK